MLKKSRKQTKSVLDLLHKSFVLTCVGATVLSTAYLGYRFYIYMAVSRPQFIEQKKLIEQKLLAEGAHENLQDTAPNIS